MMPRNAAMLLPRCLHKAFPRTKDTRTNVCTVGPDPNRVFNFFSRPAQDSFEIDLEKISQAAVAWAVQERPRSAT